VLYLLRGLLSQAGGKHARRRRPTNHRGRRGWVTDHLTWTPSDSQEGRRHLRWSAGGRDRGRLVAPVRRGWGAGWPTPAAAEPRSPWRSRGSVAPG